jgi:rfaE bifunctional protein kinase chain/domain
MRPSLQAGDPAALLEAMAGLRMAVVGDVFLDEYLLGRAERLSREGPVPVLAFRERFCVPGGAANPARNLAALGARVVQLGVIGEDAAALELRALLEAVGIETGGLVVEAGRPTTQKTRVVAEGLSAPQQVARIDRQSREPISAASERALVDQIQDRAPDLDAILVSHYRSGVVTPALCDAARRAAAERGIWLSVDAQGDLDRFHGFDLVRIGRRDAALALGRALDDEAAVQALCVELRDRLAARVIILGRGAQGTSVVDESGYFRLAPANVSEVFDVTGAGDTVIALVSLALAAGASTRAAVGLANVAAGIVVRRLGVAAPKADEILAELGEGAGPKTGPGR